MATGKSHAPIEDRYLVPAGVDWAFYDGVNGALNLMSDAEVIEHATRDYKGCEHGFAPNSTPEQAWTYIDDAWGGPGEVGWHARVPCGATWLALRDAADDHPLPWPRHTFGFGEPPLNEGTWFTPGRRGRVFAQMIFEVAGRSETADAPAAPGVLPEWACRELQAYDLAVAALGPWGRVRYWFGSWLGSTSIAYYGDGYRWWHGGQRLRQRAWLLLVPALGASERVFAVAAKVGRPM
jgi:hypothetical protein